MAAKSKENPGKSRIEKALAKRLGANVIKDVSAAAANIKYWFSTGIPALDIILSGQVGNGFPSGRICELYGEEAVGKTTLGMCVIRHAQECGFNAVLIDTESRFTQLRARKLGIDITKLTVIDEQYLENILDAIIEIVEVAGDQPLVVFWDTVASTMPLREKGCKVGEYMIGSHARPLSQGLRKLAKPLSQSNVLVLACNQLKQGGIGNMFASERDKEGLVGGKALRFHSDLRVRLYQYKKQSVDRKSVGFEVTARVVKNTNTVSDSYSKLAFTFDGGGMWDAPRSTLRTLQYWKAIETTAGRVVWGDKKIREDSWLKSYANDECFRKEADDVLVKAYAGLFLEEEPDDD